SDVKKIPFRIMTAERRSEWIDQWDGQTIRQENIYGKHVKASYTFPDEFSLPDKVWHAHRMVNEAIIKANEYPCGPVHINIPLREPFYPEDAEVFSYEKKIKVFDEIKSCPTLSEDSKLQLTTSLENYNKILIVPGQQRPNPLIADLLEKLMQDKKAVVVTDIVSNFQSDHTITYHDTFLPAFE